MTESRSVKRWAAMALAFAVGMAATIGMGLAAKGTDQAAFCATCHVMSEAAWSHKKSVHAQFDCNECHTPSNLVSKLPYKTKTGIHDILVNTGSSVPDVIHTQPEMKSVIQGNCRRCHVASTMNVAMDSKPFCTDCHRAVPHNKKLPIAQRKAADV